MKITIKKINNKNWLMQLNKENGGISTMVASRVGTFWHCIGIFTMKNMKKLLIAILILSSCTSDRLCRKALKKGCYTIDSVIVKDTLILTDFDTLVKFDTLNEVDTLYAENNGIKTVVFTKWKTREVRVVQKADTIIKERKVPEIQIKKLDCPKRKWYDNFWDGFIFGLLAFSFLMYLAFKFKSK